MNEDTNVVPFPGLTSLDVPVERVLDAAKAAELETVVVAGRNKDGDFYFYSSTAYLPEVNWDLDRAKEHVMQMSRECERCDPSGAA